MLRIDKWLWAARFYKTRNLATNAVDGGHVHVSGQRVKPSYRLKVGDLVTIKKSSMRQEIIVKELSDRRGSASIAQALYEETQDSIDQRELFAAQRKIMNQSMPRAHTKPNKHDRKKLRKVLGKL